MSRSLGIPDKVLVLARSYGVHNDCLVADVDASCADCRVLVMAAFDAIYGAMATSSLVVGAILDDLIEEGRTA